MAGSCQGWISAALLAMLLRPAGEVLPQILPSQSANALYGSVGVGFVNLERRVGVGIPIGFTAVSSPYRLIGTLNLLELALLEGSDRNPRYYRPYFGNSLCVDAQTGYSVPAYWCSGGTEALTSASADLSFILFDEVWIGDQPGRIFAGLGYRLRQPHTLYGTLGFFAHARAHHAGSVRLALGGDYVHLGIAWGIELRRLFR